MATHNTYHVTICLTVSDAQALRQAAAQLAKALGIGGRKSIRRSTEDDLIMLLDPGLLPGVEIIETVVKSPSEMRAELKDPAQSEAYCERRGEASRGRQQSEFVAVDGAERPEGDPPKKWMRVLCSLSVRQELLPGCRQTEWWR